MSSQQRNDAERFFDGFGFQVAFKVFSTALTFDRFHNVGRDLVHRAAVQPLPMEMVSQRLRYTYCGGELGALGMRGPGSAQCDVMSAMW